MPVFCRDNKFIHFIHIPKTGGASVTELLVDNGWNNIEKDKHRHREVWKSYEKNWEYQFCVTRNPYDRIESGYFHVRRAGVESGIPFTVSPSSFLEFVNLVVGYMSTNAWPEDQDNNFWRPQVDFIGDDTQVFYLEEIGDLLLELKKRKYISQDSVMPHYRHRARLSHDIKSPPGPDIFLIDAWNDPGQVHDSFVKFYKEDFEKLKYDIKRHE